MNTPDASSPTMLIPRWSPGALQTAMPFAAQPAASAPPPATCWRETSSLAARPPRPAAPPPAAGRVGGVAFFVGPPPVLPGHEHAARAVAHDHRCALSSGD